MTWFESFLGLHPPVVLVNCLWCKTFQTKFKSIDDRILLEKSGVSLARILKSQRSNSYHTGTDKLFSSFLDGFETSHKDAPRMFMYKVLFW